MQDPYAQFLQNTQSPYYNPYAQGGYGSQPYAQPQPQPQARQQTLAQVNGLEGAKAYQLSPRSSVALFDSTDAIVYIKVSDDAGFPSITPYRLEPIKEEPKIAPPPVGAGEDITELTSRVDMLEEALRRLIDNESGTATSANGSVKQSAPRKPSNSTASTDK